MYSYGAIAVASSVELSNIVLFACFPIVPRLYQHLCTKFIKPMALHYSQYRNSASPSRRFVQVPARSQQSHTWDAGQLKKPAPVFESSWLELGAAPIVLDQNSL